VNGFFGGVNVATLHVHVLGGVNVASVHVHVYVFRGAMLPLFMSMCMYGRGDQCCLCSSPCDRRVNVASVHVQVYVLGYQCCLCSCSYVGRVNVTRVHAHVLGPSMLPMFMSMCM
jgi:hypothetical protein